MQQINVVKLRGKRTTENKYHPKMHMTFTVLDKIFI